MHAITSKTDQTVIRTRVWSAFRLTWTSSTTAVAPLSHLLLLRLLIFLAYFRCRRRQQIDFKSWSGLQLLDAGLSFLAVKSKRSERAEEWVNEWWKLQLLAATGDIRIYWTKQLKRGERCWIKLWKKYTEKKKMVNRRNRMRHTHDLRCYVCVFDGKMLTRKKKEKINFYLFYSFKKRDAESLNALRCIRCLIIFSSSFCHLLAYFVYSFHTNFKKFYRINRTTDDKKSFWNTFSSDLQLSSFKSSGIQK